MAKQMLVALVLLVSLFQDGQCAVAHERARKIARAQAKEFTCTGDDGAYPSPGECTDVYYICTDGIASTQVCPASNVFDPVTFVCTPFDQASCNQKFNCQSDGLFPYPGSCTNVYYICSAGQSYIGYCPSNYIFDPVTLKCETKETASCTPKPTTEQPTTTTEVIITTEDFFTTTTTERTTYPTTVPTTESTTIFYTTDRMTTRPPTTDMTTETAI